MKTTKILTLAMVLMMMASVACVGIGNVNGATSNSTGTIELNTTDHIGDSYFSDLGATGDASYKYENNIGTLTINNFTFETTNLVALKSTVDLVIKVSGTCTIKSTNTGTKVISYGIDVSLDPTKSETHKKLTINGQKGAALNITSGNVGGVDSYSCGTVCSDLDIGGGMTVNIKGGAAEQSYGLSANNATITDSIVNASSGDTVKRSDGINCTGTLTITGKTTVVHSESGDVSSATAMSFGVQTTNISVTGGATVEFASGDLLNEESTLAITYGLYLREAGKITMTNSTGVFTSGKLSGMGLSSGLVPSATDINGSNITVISGEAKAQYASTCGMYAEYAGSHSFKNSTVSIQGGLPSHNEAISYGFCGNSIAATNVTFDNCAIKSIKGVTCAICDDGKTTVTITPDTILPFVEATTSLDDPDYKTYDATIVFTYKDIRSTTHDVTYVMDDDAGTVVTEPRAYLEKFELPECTATKEGYTFKAWSDGTNERAPGYEVTMGLEPFTFTALWTKNPEPTEKCTVTFDTGGAPGTVGPQSVDKGQKVTEPTFSWKNHILIGWYDASGHVWNFKGAVTKDMTLTAKWVADESEVNIETDGNGKVEISLPKTSEVKKINVWNGDMDLTIPEDSVKKIKDTGRNMYVTVTEVNGESEFLVTMKWDDNEDFIGNRTIAVPFYSELGTNPTVYLKEGTTETLIPSTLVASQGVITFDTDHGATFIVKYDDAKAPVSNDDYVLLIILVVTVLAVMLIATVSKK